MLILPIKKKWFDMILSGEKKEEYREIKPYYDTRFKNIWSYPAYFSETHMIRFRNGYDHTSPSFVAKVSLRIGTGKTEWGAESGKQYYVLCIHNVCKEDKNASSD